MVEKIIPVDPAASIDHLTPKGKRKHHRVDRTAQQVRYEAVTEARSSEVIPTGTAHMPGDNLVVKIRKIIGIDD